MEKDTLRQGLLQKRILVLGSNIEESKVEDLLEDLLRLSLESKEEIKLLIKSNGGDLNSAFTLADVIRSLKAPVTGIVLGRCASSALIVLLACQKRLATAHSRFYPHQASRKTSVNLDDNLEGMLKEILKDGQTTRAWIEDWYTLRANITREKAKELMHEGEVHDRHIFAEEAKQLGFIHAIVAEDSSIFEFEKD